MVDVTHILSRIEHGDPSAAEQLLPLVYEELRKLAAAKLQHATEDDDAADGVRDAHERRVKRRRHAPDHVVPDEARQHEHRAAAPVIALHGKCCWSCPRSSIGTLPRFEPY